MSRISRTSLSEDFRTLDIESGKIGEKNDCSVKAISIACDVPYAEVHALLKSLGRKSGTGTYTYLSRKAIEHLGFEVRKWSFIEQQTIIKSYPGTHSNLHSITTHHPRRFPEAWTGCHPNMLWMTSGHMLSVKDGIVHDWSINRALRVIEIWEVEKVK